MSTRSTISIVNNDGTIDGVYCHHDGYLSYVGKLLYKHWNEPAAIRDLMKKGGMSSLGATVEDCSYYNSDDADRRYWDSLDDYLKHSSKDWNGHEEYNYLFDNDGWRVYDYNMRSLGSLKEALLNEYLADE